MQTHLGTGDGGYLAVVWPATAQDGLRGRDTRTKGPQSWYAVEIPRQAPLTACGRDRQTHRQTDTRGEGPTALSLSLLTPTQPLFFLLFSPLAPPNPCNPSLLLGAGGDSRSALGTIRGLGGASVAGPGGGWGGVGAGVGGKKAPGNSGTISCWGAEGQKVGVKALDSSPPPSAHHLTGDPGGRRRASGTSGGGSRACSVLPVHRGTMRGAGPTLSPPRIPPAPKAHTHDSTPPCPPVPQHP